MADFKYTYQLSDFPNQKVDLDTLADQVRESTITIALDYINSSVVVDFFFKAQLTNPDVSALDVVVANHTGIPAPEETPLVRSQQLTEHIKWIESGEATQDLFAAQSLIIDISAGEASKSVDFSWPFDIALMSGTLGISEDMVGDDLHVDVGPNSLIGALIQPLNVGDTSIYVSPTVLENIKIGYYIGLYVPGPTGIEISQVLARDDSNYCLTINPSDVSANAGSYVAMCAKIVPELYLHSMDKVEIGKQIPTGQRIPKGVPVRVTYHNQNLVAKKVSFFVEYLY